MFLSSFVIYMQYYFAYMYIFLLLSRHLFVVLCHLFVRVCHFPIGISQCFTQFLIKNGLPLSEFPEKMSRSMSF